MRKIILLVAVLIASISLNAQTAGVLTFTVTTASTGNYSPKHIMAIWIEKADGTFVKTKLKRGNNYAQYLNTWVAKSGQNTTDATTGATLSSHSTPLSISWNATNIAGTLVPDGDYKLWIQMAYGNANGPTYSIAFTKGATAVHLTPANQTNYTAMILDWTPNTIGITENNSDISFTVSPNPCRENAIIKYTVVGKSVVKVLVYDIAGKLVNVLVNETKDSGDYSINWDATDKKGARVVAGIYYISINNDNKVSTKKLVVLK